MKVLGRILLGLVATGALIVITINWIAPSALSFYGSYKAPKVARQVPRPLTESSVSQVAGSKLSFVGWDFEVPWTDLDDSETKLYPEKSTEKHLADIRFRSGLRIMLSAIPAGEWTRGIPQTMKLSAQQAERVFGHDAMKSDYDFVKALYEFNPATMQHWAPSPQVQGNEQAWLILKSLALLKAAESGIFVLTTPTLRGFQEGNPSVRQDGIAVHLFAENGSVELIFFQKDYKSSTGVTQAEINRIVQTIHQAPPSASLAEKK